MENTCASVTRSNDFDTRHALQYRQLALMRAQPREGQAGSGGAGGSARWAGGLILPTETRYIVCHYVRCETMPCDRYMREVFAAHPRAVAKSGPGRQCLALQCPRYAHWERLATTAGGPLDAQRAANRTPLSWGYLANAACGRRDATSSGARHMRAPHRLLGHIFATGQ